jgi:hypothetical protein
MKPTLTVYGLAYNCGATVRRALDSVGALAQNFGATRYAILGTNGPSRPLNLGTSAHVLEPTMGALDAWASDDRTNRTVQDIAAPTFASRWQRMAHLRNRVLQMAPVADWNLIVDLDIQELVDLGGVQEMLAQQDYGAVAVYGIRPWSVIGQQHVVGRFEWRGQMWGYYDLLAFESKTGERVMRPDYSILSPRPDSPAFGEWTEVNSAFGPATFYRKDVFQCDTCTTFFKYDECPPECEHLSFHAAMRKRGQRIAVNGNIVGIYY